MHNRPTLIWWGRPRNFDDRKNERKISWLELFYDLVYVAAIAQLTHQVAEHPSWHVVSFSFLLFALVFWSWVNGSQYYDLHGSDSIRTRLMTFWQMLSVAAVAITIPDAFKGDHQYFAGTFAVLQIMITYLWWSVGLYDPSHRKFNKFYTFNYLISFALLIISIFTSAHIAAILWIIVLILNLTPPLTGAMTIRREMAKRGQVFTASEAIVERFGLFTIIVLAESILGTVTGIAQVKDRAPGAWFAFILAILISFLIWSLYFDMTSEQETKKGYKYLQWLVFLHFPLLFSMSVMGACINVSLANMIAPLSATIEWMFCLSLALILFMIVAVASIMKEEEEDMSYIKPVSRILIITGICILIIPLIFRSVYTTSFLGIISVVLFVPVFVGLKSWVQYKYFGKK